MFLWANKAKYLLGLLMLLLVMLSGCGQSSQVEMNNYVMVNGLTVEQADAEEYVDGQGTAVTIYNLQISGLEDSALMQQINERIAETIKELTQAPPPDYRGIKIYVPQEAVLNSQWVNVSVNGNFNNILSLVFYRGMEYDIPGEEYGTFINQVETLNLDLNTGQDITLAELFPKDSDYLTLLDNQIREELEQNYATEEAYYSMSQLKLVTPFTGLRPEQKFSVSPWGLTLYFDEETPEFDTNFYSASVFVPNGQLWALKPFAQGFYDPEKSLYTDASLQTPNLLNWGWKYDRSLDDYSEEDGLYVSVMCQYSSKLPQTVQDKIVELAKVEPAELDTIKLQPTAQDAGTSYEVAVWTQCYGDYISVTRSVYCYAAGQQMANDKQCFVYHADTGEAVELTDLFKTGVAYEPLIQKALAQASGQESTVWDESLPWSVSDDGLLLNAKNAQGETIDVLVAYKDIGPDNLVIFH